MEKGEKDSNMQLTRERNLAVCEERRVVQTEVFMVCLHAFSSAWGKSPARHCQLPEGPFSKSHFRHNKSASW